MYDLALYIFGEDLFLSCPPHVQAILCMCIFCLVFVLVKYIFKALGGFF